MEMLFIGVVLAAAMLALFTLGWTLATAFLCTKAFMQGEDYRAVLRDMLEEW